MRTHKEHRAPRVASVHLSPMAHNILSVNLPKDEPHYFFDQAYAVASTLEDTLRRDDPCNADIDAAAARGICTLIHLTATAIANAETRDGERSA